MPYLTIEFTGHKKNNLVISTVGIFQMNPVMSTFEFLFVLNEVDPRSQINQTGFSKCAMEN